MTGVMLKNQTLIILMLKLVEKYNGNDLLSTGIVCFFVVLCVCVVFFVFCFFAFLNVVILSGKYDEIYGPYTEVFLHKMPHDCFFFFLLYIYWQIHQTLICL